MLLFYKSPPAQQVAWPLDFKVLEAEDINVFHEGGYDIIVFIDLEFHKKRKYQVVTLIYFSLSAETRRIGPSRLCYLGRLQRG